MRKDWRSFKIQEKDPDHGCHSSGVREADKAKANRRFRRTLKELISPELDAPLPTERQLTNRWDMAKEGKSRYDPKLGSKFKRK
jgi:hypothetical protein